MFRNECKVYEYEGRKLFVDTIWDVVGYKLQNDRHFMGVWNVIHRMNQEDLDMRYGKAWEGADGIKKIMFMNVSEFERFIGRFDG